MNTDEGADPAVDVVWKGERVRVTPSGEPARIDWATVAATLTDLSVREAGIVGPDVRDLESGQGTVLEVLCGPVGQTVRRLHFRVELAR